MLSTILRRKTQNVLTINNKIGRTAATSNGIASSHKTGNLKSWRDIPGPSSLPLIGPLLHFLPGGSFHGMSRTAMNVKLYETYGPIVRLDALIGMDPVIFLYDAESSEQILRGENNMPERLGLKSLHYYRHHVKKAKPGEITGLATEDGEAWKQLRSRLNPIMLQPKSIKLYTQTLDDVALDMVDRIKSLKESKILNENFNQEIELWSLESIGAVALGSRIGCLTPNLPEDAPAKRLLRCVHELFQIAEKLDYQPNIWKYISTSTFKRAMKLYVEQESLSRYFIQNAIKDLKEKPNSVTGKSILEKLLEIDENVAYTLACDMLFGGVDTTAITVIATLYLLAVNQDKQIKLRQELKDDPISKAYLKACIKESMRIMPVAAGNARVTTRVYDIMGYRIPEKTVVLFDHQTMSMMEKYYVRSKEYIPERWLVDKSDPLCYKHAHLFAFNLFGFGVRSCIGRRIAELEIETFLARIIENFHLQWNGLPPKVKPSALNYITGPFHFVFNNIKN